MPNRQKCKSGRLYENVSLQGLNAWKIGGVAEHYFKPGSLESCAQFLKTYPHNKSVTWLGLGSNLLIRDSGVEGCVIHTLSGLNKCEYDQKQQLFRVQAGVPCCQFSRFVARNNHKDSAFLAGVPGTMGGALAMNAGAHGAELWDFVESVEVINRQGDVVSVPASEFHVSYRFVEAKPNRLDLRNTWFVSASLKFPKGDVESSLEKIKQLLEIRSKTQPINLPNCGSVFRNPPNNYAAKLIEAAGLKGYQVGQAQVSHKHANFIVNLGGASSCDIEKLIAEMQQQVFAKYQCQLNLEVKIIGKSI